MVTMSQGLRVIGQEFEKIQVADFEVTVDEEGCHVRGSLPPAPPAPPPPQPNGGWSLKRLFKGGDPAPSVAPEPEPQPRTWEHRYAWADLDRLDEEYRSARRRAAGVPDDYSPSHMLRVVGAYVEGQRWTLVGVSRNRQLIDIRYRRSDGRVDTVSQRFAEFYDFAVRLSKARQGE
jgi:hypothetical protein